MTQIKLGGIVLSGIGAFLLIEKALNTVSHVADKVCEARKWKEYYRCRNSGEEDFEPVAPGYSITIKPRGEDYEIVKDCEGKDHSQDEAKEEKTQNTDKIKDICDILIKGIKTGVETLAKKTEKDSQDGSDELRGASEGLKTAFPDDIMPDMPKDEPMYAESLEDGVYIVEDDDEEDQL